MNLCDLKDCGQKALYVPKLLFYAPKRYGNAALTCYIALNVCVEHSKTLKVDDVISDAGWNQIVGSIRRAGRMIPDRTRTELHLASREEAEEYWRRSGGKLE